MPLAAMARKKTMLRRIENPSARQVTFCKRKEGILKKANELAVLCDTDVAIVLFSPSGRLTCFASNGRVEDILLRFMDCPDDLRGGELDSEELLVQKLKKSKYEAEMLQKIGRLEELQEQLQQLEIRKSEAEKKLRLYNPDVEKINSVSEAELYERFLENAIERMRLAKAKLLGKVIDVQNVDNPEIVPNHSVDLRFWNPTTNGVDDTEIVPNYSADLGFWNPTTKGIDATEIVPNHSMDLGFWNPTTNGVDNPESVANHSVGLGFWNPTINGIDQNVDIPEIVPNHDVEMGFWNPPTGDINQVVASYEKGESSTARQCPGFHQNRDIVEHQANKETSMPTGLYPTLGFIESVLSERAWE